MTNAFDMVTIYDHRAKLEPGRLNEWEAQRALRWLYGHHELTAPGMDLCGHEMDFCVVTRTGFIYEIEIKISRGDWLADQKKSKWNHEGRHISDKISRFYYAVPAELAGNIPEFVKAETGIIALSSYSNQYIAAYEAKVIRQAKQISKYKASPDDKLKIASSLHHRFWYNRGELQMLKSQYRDLQRRHDARIAADRDKGMPQ